jgi:hypothetical protein
VALVQRIRVMFGDLDQNRFRVGSGLGLKVEVGLIGGPVGVEEIKRGGRISYGVGRGSGTY